MFNACDRIFFTRASQNIKKSVFFMIKFIFNGNTLDFHYEFNGVESVVTKTRKSKQIKRCN